jgi:hypothetical protein
MGRRNRGHERKLLRLDNRARRLEQRHPHSHVTYGGNCPALGRRAVADWRRDRAAQRCGRCWPTHWEILP